MLPLHGQTDYLLVCVCVCVSSCVNMAFGVCPSTGSRSTSRQEATPTPSGCPTEDQTIRVKDAHMNHWACVLVWVIVTKLSIMYFGSYQLTRAANLTKHVPPSRFKNLIDLCVLNCWQEGFCSEWLPNHQGCAYLPGVTQFNHAALWWPRRRRDLC